MIKKTFSVEDARNFNDRWPDSKIELRPHWAEFDRLGSLCDHNFTEEEDGPEVLALISDDRYGRWRKGT